MICPENKANNKQNLEFSYMHTLTTWHWSHSPAPTAAIDRYLPPASKPAAVGLLLWAHLLAQTTDGHRINCTRKAHPCAETRHMTYRSSKSVYGRWRSAIPRIKKEKRSPVRSQSVRHVTCSPRPPTLSQRHMDLHVLSYPRRNYIF